MYSCTIYFIWLQDSLGGNSKTTIIANVSPSLWSVFGLFISFECLTDFCIAQSCLCNCYIFICSAANETLSTLKFAQRAKLIQNNVGTLKSLSFLFSHPNHQCCCLIFFCFLRQK